MSNTGINGDRAYRSFTQVADRFTQSTNADGSKLSKAEIGVLQNMLASMGSLQKERAMSDLKLANYDAYTELKAAK